MRQFLLVIITVFNRNHAGYSLAYFLIARVKFLWLLPTLFSPDERIHPGNVINIRRNYRPDRYEIQRNIREIHDRRNKRREQKFLIRVYGGSLFYREAGVIKC